MQLVEYQVHHTPTTPGHLPDLVEIDYYSTDGFDRTMYESDFRRYLGEKTHVGMTFKISNVPVAFILYELRDGSYHVDRFVVRRELRRYGVGQACLEIFLETRLGANRPTATVTVEETNLAAQLFLKACGLRAKSVDTSQGTITFAARSTVAVPF